LRTLLEETNGIYNTDTQYYEVWSAGEIGYRNQGLRDDSQLAEMYMSFESLLFFASPGVDGIQFAFPITASGTVRDKNIIVWYPIEDSRPVIAMSLKDFLIRWFKGDLVL